MVRVFAAVAIASTSIIGSPQVAHAVSTSPSWTVVAGNYDRTSPAIGDINGDGVNDIVVASLDGYVRVFDGNGGLMWAAPIKPDGVHLTGSESSPALADINNDGLLDVVVGAGSLNRQAQNGGVVAFDSKGAPLWHFQTNDVFNVWTGTGGPDGYSEGVFGTPAVGDIDGDGFRDIVFGSWDHGIYALNHNGSVIAGFPIDNHDTIFSSASLYDVDGDGRLEIFIGSDQSTGGTDIKGGLFRVLDVQGSYVATLWSYHTNEVFYGSPTIADIDGDGRLEAVVSTGFYWSTVTPGGVSDGKKVYAFHINDGSLVNGWPVTIDGLASGSVAVGDITNDDNGKPEVVLGDLNGYLYAWRGNGTRIWKTNPGAPSAGPLQLNGQPILADFDGNGTQDVAIGNNFELVVRGDTGAPINSQLGAQTSLTNSAAVGNFGAAGWRLITVGNNSAGQGVIASYGLPNQSVTPAAPLWRGGGPNIGAPKSGGNPLPPGQCAASTNPPANPNPNSSKGYWMMGRDGGVFSFNRTFYGSLPGVGVVDNTISAAPTPTGNGYWLVSAAGRVYAFGDATVFGDMSGTRLNAPIIRLESTTSGRGYWLLASDGGVFSFGDAAFYGSTGALNLNAPVVGMAATTTGRGYWLVASDGGIFAFGDAAFRGSTGGIRLAAPIVSMTPRPQGDGYWLLGADGGVFSFNVPFFGSIPGVGLCQLPRGVQIRTSSTGNGYFIVSADGGMYTFGDAMFRGAFPGLGFGHDVVDLAVVR